jgi:hypothetical protein
VKARRIHRKINNVAVACAGTGTQPRNDQPARSNLDVVASAWIIYVAAKSSGGARDINVHQDFWPEIFAKLH